MTTKMRPGTCEGTDRHSQDAVITEYYDRFDIPDGDSLLLVSTEVVDPMYLTAPFWTSTHFRNKTTRRAGIRSVVRRNRGTR